MKKNLLKLLALAAVGSTCWFSAQRQIARAYNSGVADGSEAMLMHVLENEVHRGPIVVEAGAVVSNLAVTVIVWPDQQASGVVIESNGTSGSCYLDEMQFPRTLVSHCYFDFTHASEIR